MQKQSLDNPIDTISARLSLRDLPAVVRAFPRRASFRTSLSNVPIESLGSLPNRVRFSLVKLKCYVQYLFPFSVSTRCPLREFSCLHSICACAWLDLLRFVFCCPLLRQRCNHRLVVSHPKHTKHPALYREYTELQLHPRRRLSTVLRCFAFAFCNAARTVFPLIVSPH